MEKLIKNISAKNGELSVITSGQRIGVADFEGRIEIFEENNLIPILGTLHNSVKKIYASFIVCGNLDYCGSDSLQLINSGNVFEAIADIVLCDHAERLDFAGLQFEDSDPIKNELTFRITDLRLIEKLIKEA